MNEVHCFIMFNSTQQWQLQWKHTSEEIHTNTGELHYCATTVTDVKNQSIAEVQKPCHIKHFCLHEYKSW